MKFLVGITNFIEGFLIVQVSYSSRRILGLWVLTFRRTSEVGLSWGIFWRQESTKFRKYSDLVVTGGWGRGEKGMSQATLPYGLTPRPRDPSPYQCPDWSTGDSFCAMWYKALIAFMLNSGGFRSATKKGQVGENERWQWVEETGMEIWRFEFTFQPLTSWLYDSEQFT